MIIDDFNTFSTAIFPNETDPPLVIDANRMLPFAIPAQGLQPVSGRNPQILKGMSRHQILELPIGHAFKGAKPPNRFPSGKRLRILVSKRSYHHNSKNDIFDGYDILFGYYCQPGPAP